VVIAHSFPFFLLLCHYALLIWRSFLSFDLEGGRWLGTPPSRELCIEHVQTWITMQKRVTKLNFFVNLRKHKLKRLRVCLRSLGTRV